MSDKCSCLPCKESHGPPAYGLDCCMNFGIEEYDHDCPIGEHQRMAELQFPKRDALNGDNDE